MCFRLAGPLSGLIALPLSSSLSDLFHTRYYHVCVSALITTFKHSCRWGRRRPFIVAGTYHIKTWRVLCATRAPHEQRTSVSDHVVMRHNITVTVSMFAGTALTVIGMLLFANPVSIANNLLGAEGQR
jgi:hypothetical protein